MDTQNTPIHIKLWHTGFWSLAVANLLMSSAVYMLLVTVPLEMSACGIGLFSQGGVMLAYGVGVFILGCMVSWLVQRYRRYKVCDFALIMMAVVMFCYYLTVIPHVSALFLLCQFLIGVFFGLAEMVLTSTLVNDTCESFQRTEANHAISWFNRFAISIGPVAGIILYNHAGFRIVAVVAAVLAVSSAVLVRSVPYPFKAPEDNFHMFSTDRFFLGKGLPLFINLSLIIVAFGLIMSVPHRPIFYAMMMPGFFLALLSEKYVFENADLKSEAIAGLIAVMAGALVMLSPVSVAAVHISPVLFGFGFGIIGSRFLLFFIKLSDHCKRGTSQSTYVLAWEFGLALGLSAGIAVAGRDVRIVPLAVIAVCLAALLLYNFLIHPWYLHNKNR